MRCKFFYDICRNIFLIDENEDYPKFKKLQIER